MGICYIVGAGDCTETITPRAGDLVIAADGGLTHLSRMGITPDLFVGDFDSTPSAGDSPTVLRHPTVKDDTDMALALRAGEERGYREFYLYGALGGARFDHSIANLQLLLACAGRGLCVTLVSRNQRTRVLRNGEKLHFPATARGYVSVFAMGGKAHGVTLTGLKYPLDGATLSPDCPLGVSNELCGRDAVITHTDGYLLVCYESEE